VQNLTRGSAALSQARSAFRKRAWKESFGLFSAIDRAAPLSPEDLECLATAAYLAGEDDASVAAWVRAHKAHLQAQQVPRAVRCAFWMILQLMSSGDWARASGWLATAQRLLDGGGHDCAERGLLSVLVARGHFKARDLAAARDVCVETLALSDRFDDPELRIFARLTRGLAHADAGEVEAALTLFDEAMVGVTTAEVSPIAVGIVYCATIDACSEVMDPARAREWTSALSNWCATQPELVAFRGHCLVHRAETFRLCGDWTTALEESARASGRGSPGSALEPVRAVHGHSLGAAFYESGEIHRLRGRFAEAEEDYRLASEHGRLPEPGLALLRLAQGRDDAAATAIRRMLAQRQKRSTRALVLAAAVEVLLATGDVATARTAASELAALTAAAPTPFVRALSAQTAGRLLLAANEPAAALEQLRAAWLDWQAIDIPYEAARTREMMGRACARLGDSDAAEMEFEAAHCGFLRLDALPDATRVSAAIPSSRAAELPALTPRELQVIRLLATGKTNKAIAHDLVVSERTIDRHVSNILTKLDLPSRAAATAYAYQHRLV
jgi:DNA-binding CsgD family transcriptional regulator